MPILGGGNFPGAVTSEPKQIGRISGPLLKANLERKGIDLAFETDLLYLDVQCRKVAIRKKVHCSPSTADLEIVSNAVTTNLISENYFNVGTTQFVATGIKSDTGSITISSPLGVVMPALKTDDFKILENKITSTLTNSNIVIDPGGMTNLLATTEVTGNVHVNGNVLFYTRTISTPLQPSEVNNLSTNVKPSQDITYDIGSTDKRWLEGHFETLNLDSLILPVLPPGFDVPLTLPGNTYFVGVNGKDTNIGRFQTNPFKTIKHALSVAVPGDTIYIYSGTFTEDFPLTVPAGVHLKGRSLRTTKIQPSTGTIDKDALLLNGDTIVEDLTILGFRYNSTNNTGYAFKFAPGMTVTSKSPYIRNVSVITQGSTVSSLDPRGYNTHDAGKGAFIDGSAANASSKEASMLFYGVTFITPGVDAITMKNGVRVEWINSFTYFASKGIYALQGTEGFANLGVKFGAEMRSMSSANVYGEYGVYGDGANVVIYLVGHNFAYIGAGKDTSNDVSLVVKAYEVVKLNSAKIYFNSVDQQGNFKIGDAFDVNFVKGTTSFDAQGINFSGLSNITIQNDGHTTILSSSRAKIDNFNISGSTIETITGPMNLKTAGGLFYIDEKVNIVKNAEVSGTVNLKGDITVGNQTTDTVSISMQLNQDILPKTASTYKIGSNLNKWATSYINRIDTPSVIVDNDTITALDTNLQLTGNGTAGVLADKITFKDNVISTTVSNINLKTKPFTGTVVYIDSTNSLRLPIGTTADRAILNQGELRYNTTDSVFAAYGTAKTALGGVYSADRRTKVVAHPTNNTISFIANNTTIAGVDTGGFNATRFVAGQLDITNNQVTTSGTTNLIVSTSGTASTTFNSIKLEGSTLTNPSSSLPLVFTSTGTGYYRLLATTAMLIPVTTLATQPLSPEVGDLRYNPDTVQLEVYDQGQYNNSSGVGGSATREDVADLTDIWTLILG